MARPPIHPGEILADELDMLRVAEQSRGEQIKATIQRRQLETAT